MIQCFEDRRKKKVMDACGCRGQMLAWEVLIDAESPSRFSANYKFILRQTDH